MKKILKWLGVILSIVCVMIACINIEKFSAFVTNLIYPEPVVFQADVLEITDTTCLVKPKQAYPEYHISDQIVVPLVPMDSCSTLEVGDKVEIEYRGRIMESYPAQIKNVLRIEIIAKTSIMV